MRVERPVAACGSSGNVCWFQVSSRFVPDDFVRTSRPGELKPLSGLRGWPSGTMLSVGVSIWKLAYRLTLYVVRPGKCETAHLHGQL